MTTYTNSHSKFDVAIDGVPFFLGPTSEYPYVRQSGEFRRQQVDMTGEPGEQSLTSWWYRSQSSFHMGAGMKYYDPIRGAGPDQYRFWDSAGVDVFTQKGDVSLLRTSVLEDATATWGDMISWAYDGDSGVLYEDGMDLRCWKASTGASFVVAYENGSDGSDNIWSITSSGSQYWVLNAGGIWKGDLPGAGGTTKVYAVPAADDNGVIRWCMERLFCGINNRLYLLTDFTNDGHALPTQYAGDTTGRLLYTHPEDDWRWSAIAPGPDAVFFAGYAGTYNTIHGNRSVIYASTIEIDNISGDPQTTVPSIAAELPHGEYVLGMESYLNTYLVLSTTKGVRICAIGQNGQVTLGPLTVEIANYSYDATVWGNFVYAAGASVDGYDGVYVIDLTAPVDQSGLRFAYAKGVATGYLSASAGYMARVCMVGTTGRIAMMVKNSGLWIEDATELVSSGWIQTGIIKFDTWQQKIFDQLRSAYDPATAGNVQPYHISQEGTVTSLGAAADVSGVPFRDTDGSPDGEGKLWAGYRWVLSRKTTTTGPTFRGYRVRALPANVVQREYMLPLLCYRKERMRGGRTVTRSVWDRVDAIETLERTGKVITFQDFNTGESKEVVIAGVRFITDRPAQSQVEADNPGGMLVVTLRTAD